MGPSMEDKPRNVVIALRIMWVLWAMGALYLITAFALGISAGVVGSDLALGLGIMYLAVIAALGFLVHSVSKGKNWARLTYTALACVSIGLTALALIGGTRLTPIFTVIALGVIASYVIILWLLYQGDAAAWFKRSRTSAS